MANQNWSHQHWMPKRNKPQGKVAVVAEEEDNKLKII